MERLTLQRFPLAAGHPVHIRTGHGGAAGVGAVFSRARPALADTLHHALLHGAGSLAHGIPVVGQPVGMLTESV